MSEAVDGEVIGIVGNAVEPVVTAVENAGFRAETAQSLAALSAEDTDRGRDKDKDENENENEYMDESGGDPSALIVVGDHALCGLVNEPTSVRTRPVLPVDAGSGVRSVPLSTLPTAIEQFIAGQGTADTYPVVAALVDGTVRARALMDLTLITAKPAKISEYAVSGDGVAVDCFRADGVVVATPAGTHGYARRIGAPVIAPGSSVAAVTPIAPFATDANHWILPPEDIELSVERDESTVHLLADDRTVGPVPAETPISVSVVDHLTLRRVPASSRPFRVQNH